MDIFHDLPFGEKNLKTVNVVIENFKGSSNKVEYKVEKGVFQLDRTLHSSVYWPCEYGLIPRTWNTDNDPIDILVLSSQPTFSGCIIIAKPIGMLKMEDEKGIDNKIVSVSVHDPIYGNTKNMKELPKNLLKEIKEFLSTYKHLEMRKWVKFKGWGDSIAAKKEIKRAIQLYKKRFGVDV
jgi:inorganic pyrophosphatase